LISTATQLSGGFDSGRDDLKQHCAAHNNTNGGTSMNNINAWCKLAFAGFIGMLVEVLAVAALAAAGVHPNAVQGLAATAMLAAIYTVANLKIARHNRRSAASYRWR